MGMGRTCRQEGWWAEGSREKPSLTEGVFSAGHWALGEGPGRVEGPGCPGCSATLQFCKSRSPTQELGKQRRRRQAPHVGMTGWSFSWVGRSRRGNTSLGNIAYT